VEQSILLLIQFGHDGDEIAARLEQLPLGPNVFQYHAHSQLLRPRVSAAFLRLEVELSDAYCSNSDVLKGVSLDHFACDLIAQFVGQLAASPSSLARMRPKSNRPPGPIFQLRPTV
jgi:hypothetical protein